MTEQTAARLRIGAVGIVLFVLIALATVVVANVVGGDGEEGATELVDPAAVASGPDLPEGALDDVGNNVEVPDPSAGGVNDAPLVDVEELWTMPDTDDPIELGTAYATALLSYDTRVHDLEDWTQAMDDLAADPRVDPGDSQRLLRQFLPDAGVFADQSRAGQSGRFEPTNAWIPDSWWEEVESNPAMLDELHAQLVTVEGEQHLTYDEGTTAIPRAVTVVLLCENGECRPLMPGARVIR